MGDLSRNGAIESASHRRAERLIVPARVAALGLLAVGYFCFQLYMASDRAASTSCSSALTIS